MVLLLKSKAYAFAYVSQARRFIDLPTHNTAAAGKARCADLAIKVRRQAAMSTKARKEMVSEESDPGKSMNPLSNIQNMARKNRSRLDVKSLLFGPISVGYRKALRVFPKSSLPISLLAQFNGSQRAPTIE
jgi:hypothetical protein